MREREEEAQKQREREEARKEETTHSGKYSAHLNHTQGTRRGI